MIIQGKAYWAKIIGAPQGGFDKSVLEWSMDLAIDAETRKKLEAEGLKSKIKNKGDDRGDFIQFKRKAVKSDGTSAKPIRVVGPGGKNDLWDDRKIGNGSKVNVSMVINDTEYGGKKFKKPGIIAVQVIDYVPYEGGDYEEFPEYDDAGTEQWGDET